MRFPPLACWALLASLCCGCVPPSPEKASGDQSPEVGEELSIQVEGEPEAKAPDLRELAQSQAEPEEPLDITDDVVPPTRISGESIGFGSSTCHVRRPPIIILEAVIGTTGRVTSIRFLKDVPPECAQQLIREALDTWRYEPARLNGQPVAVRFNLTVNIDLQ